MPDNYTIAGRRIAEIRKRRRMSQSDLAEKLGITLDSVSRIERGATAPRIDRMDEIAQVLVVPLWTLFRADDSPAAATTGKAAVIQEVIAMMETRDEAAAKLVRDVVARILADR